MQACVRAGTAPEEKTLHEKHPKGRGTGWLGFTLDPCAMLLNSSCVLEEITYCIFLLFLLSFASS